MIWGVLQFPGSCDARDALNACILAEQVGLGDALSSARNVVENVPQSDSHSGGGAGSASDNFARNGVGADPDDVSGRGGVSPDSASGSRLVWHEETDLSGFDAIIVPGGFSYGDYLRAGAIARFAPAMTAVAEFAADGGLVLGICNGFQVLCESGLLPGALLTNTGTRFICRQADLIVGEADSPFLATLEPGQRISMPFKHQSGRFFAPPEMLEQIEANNQVAFRYAPGQNPNGSLNDIAGVTNEAGNVLGLMPHPEHAIEAFSGSTDGLALFRGPEQALAGAVA